MFNFRYTTLYFFITLLILNLFLATGARVPWYYYAGLIFIYLFVSVFMSFFICSGFHMKVPCHGPRNENKIALTFDDGPDPANTPMVLDILRESGVKAVFFVIGRKLAGHEELVRRIAEEGHLVGGHSYSHSDWFDFFPWRKMRSEFIRTDEEIREITGISPTLFRPPYGVINPMVRKAMLSQNYGVIGFSNRLWDTVAQSQEKIVSRFRKNLRGGDIVLLHDTIPCIASVLKEVIRHARSKGYELVRADELLNLSAHETH
jgi:peptidoglycan/xylan/chitin deacetylase (PgdA/CDA1 family)